MNVMTQEVPEHVWPVFFGDVSNFYRGWGVRVQVMRRDVGDQFYGHEELPLRAVSMEPGGSAAGDILIEAGDDFDFRIFRVHRPHTIRLTESQPGREADLEIESGDGTITIATFTSRLALPAASWQAPQPPQWFTPAGRRFR